MKTKRIILFIFLILLATGVGNFVFQRNQRMPVVQAQKDIYYCPMHPHYTSDHPGNCPICGMKLVKKEKAVEETSIKESVPGYSTVSLDTHKQQLIGIKTTTVIKKDLVKTIHAYGYVAHDLELYNAQLEYIDAWHVYYAFNARRPVKGEYQADWKEYYKKDAPQGRWRSDEKLKAQQRFIKAEYELKHMGINDTQLAQLREIKYGQPWIQPDLLFFHEGHPVWVYAQIPESDLGFVDVGQKAIIIIPTYGETTEGIVRNVALMVDPNTRTTQVRIELPSYKGELKVNMYVNVDMPVELNTSLVIPREAIMDTGLNKIVFVQTQEGIFEPRHIQTGFEGDGMVAVKSGLKEGETIVAAGNFLLDSESRLQGSLASGGQ